MIVKIIPSFIEKTNSLFNLSITNHQKNFYDYDILIIQQLISSKENDFVKHYCNYNYNLAYQPEFKTKLINYLCEPFEIDLKKWSSTSLRLFSCLETKDCIYQRLWKAIDRFSCISTDGTVINDKEDNSIFDFLITKKREKANCLSIQFSRELIECYVESAISNYLLIEDKYLTHIHHYIPELRSGEFSTNYKQLTPQELIVLVTILNDGKNCDLSNNISFYRLDLHKITRAIRGNNYTKKDYRHILSIVKNFIQIEIFISSFKSLTLKIGGTLEHFISYYINGSSSYRSKYKEKIIENKNIQTEECLVTEDAMLLAKSL